MLLQSQLRKLLTSAIALTCATVMATSPAFCKSKAQMPSPVGNSQTLFGHEPWPGQRAVLILPIEFGSNYNLDKKQSQDLLPEIEQKMQQALQRTGKFSTTQAHRYNTVLLRAVQEKLVTKEQVDKLVATPTLADAQDVWGKVNYHQKPLIAQMTIDEVEVEAGMPSPTVSTVVTGKLYEPGNAVPIRSVVLTSNPQPLYRSEKRDKKLYMVRSSARSRIIAAADNAFSQVAQEFVKPVGEITLPEPTVAEGVTPATAVAGYNGPPIVIKVPQGQVLGTFTIPAEK